MKKKFSINVLELKDKMNPIIKYVLFYPMELIIYIFNYIYIAILTSYFRVGLEPEITIDKVHFDTQINIDYQHSNFIDNESDDDESNDNESNDNESNDNESIDDNTNESNDNESDDGINFDFYK